MLVFQLKQTCERVSNENCLNWNFLVTHFLYICIKIFEKTSKMLKVWQKWDLKKTGTSLEQRFSFKDNQWQNTWQKVRQSSKTWQNPITLISGFA